MTKSRINMGKVEFDFMVFEWDDNKNAINKTKHGLSFETAINH